jgi:alpha-L-rhamnosidase
MKTLLIRSRLVIATMLLLTPTGPVAAATIAPVDLRCEYLCDPLGIDARQPRLSWRSEALSADTRGDRQTAYQILVASSENVLAGDRGDLWDTGKVASDQSLHVVYAGRALTSEQACWWKVRVWDQDGQGSSWSASARWTMGLLQPGEWRGRWIGRDEPPAPATANVLVSGHAQWIWFPGENGATTAPLATRYFRRTFELPADRKISRGELILAADNEFATAVNGDHAGAGSSFKSGVVMDVTKSLRAGRNLIAAWVKNAGLEPNPAGLAGVLRVEFETGPPLVIATDASWKTFDRDMDRWTILEGDDSAWRAAEVLAPVGGGPWGEVTVTDENRRLAARMLRKEFAVTRPVVRAMAYFSGLGLSELYLNGDKVGNHVLSPALTDYTKRVPYVTYDVTSCIRQGANALGVWLGNGRFYAPRSNAPTGTVGYGYPMALLQLVLEYADGSRDAIVSDGTWRLTTRGPIVANNEYDGEEYDARLEMPGWCRADFDDTSWEPAQLVTGPPGKLVAQMMDPIRVTGHLQPKKVHQPQPGVFIYDLGQNMVGWCRLKVAGPAGTAVTLRHAETLRPDGTLYLDNIRGAKVTDIYTLKGHGTETYEPRFTYHGFRFVEVTGFPGTPGLDALEGCVVNDDLASAGTFVCSQPTINRIYSNILWGVRGNYRSIPTDCPQRDERQGWLGDRSVESKGETFLFHNAPLYAKWVQDIVDAQKDSGSVPDVCPAYWPIYSDNVTWPSSLVIIPGTLYEQYGDTQVIALAYPSMVKWIDYMSTFIVDDLMPRDTYGDWCVPPEDPKLIHSQDPARKTAGPFLGTTYFYHCLQLMTRYATLLDRPDDAQRFAALAERLKNGLNAKFFQRDLGQYDNGAQTTSVLPLAFNMVPDDQRQRVFDHLVRKITQETRGHVGTGLVGGQWLNRVLTAGGRPDISYGFATHTDYPSWGYMVAKDATTIWELWNGDTADPAMNSGNHVMLVGDLVIWLYEHLAGIQADPAQPAFKHIVMRPLVLGDLEFVTGSHQSPYGLVASHWRRDGKRLQWHVTVPPNTSATVSVPASAEASVTESGQPVGDARGVKVLRREPGHVVLEVVAGEYRFESTVD